MGLETYKHKRNFTATSEPLPRVSHAKQHRFVVQEHHASHLHWDLRLEMSGVLKSWAVPKGVPMEPHIRRLAIMTEDHPVEYLTFHGSIPEGSYGAGQMDIWDSGTYDLDQKGRPDAAVASGKLSIHFHGERMDGYWEMVKTSDEENHWLLFKVDEARSVPLTKKPIADAADGAQEARPAADRVAGALPAAMPSQIRPMLAVAAAKPFSNPDWVYEVKWDGYRAICFVQGGKQTLVSRNQLPLDARFPELNNIMRELACERAVVDGEIVGLDEGGSPRFQLLQNRGFGKKSSHVRTSPHSIVYYAFDLLYLDGISLTGAPLTERKRLLQSIIRPNGVVRYSDHIAGKGIEFFEQVKVTGLEGMVAKEADSKYVQARSDCWRKVKAIQTIDAVIGGYTDPNGSRSGFGALLVGLYGADGLVSVGRAGSGFDRKELDRVYGLLKVRSRDTSPFAGPVPGERGAHWVEPQLVCEVKFTEMTDDGQMRHPTYLRMRDDKDPHECTLSVGKQTARPPAAPMGPPASKQVRRTKEANIDSARALTASPRPDNINLNVDGADVRLTHLNKVFWPSVAKTKGDLVAYYHAVNRTVLPYLKDRPLILQRYPNGVDAAFFFQHDVDNPPPYAATFSDKALADHVDYLICNNLATLLYIANLGVIPLHPLSIRTSTPRAPDWIVFDLDPEPKALFADVCRLAIALRELLDELGLRCYAKTSGSAGMHVYVPLAASYTFDDCVRFATVAAEAVRKRVGSLVTLERMTRNRKPAQIYLDCLQNAAGKSVAGPYSARATPEATVSAPLTWSEVESCPAPTDFTIDTVPSRLAELGDPWADLLAHRQSLSQALVRLAEIIG